MTVARRGRRNRITDTRAASSVRAAATIRHRRRPSRKASPTAPRAWPVLSPRRIWATAHSPPEFAASTMLCRVAPSPRRRRDGRGRVEGSGGSSGVVPDDAQSLLGGEPFEVYADDVLDLGRVSSSGPAAAKRRVVASVGHGAGATGEQQRDCVAVVHHLALRPRSPITSPQGLPRARRGPVFGRGKSKRCALLAYVLADPRASPGA